MIQSMANMDSRLRGNDVLRDWVTYLFILLKRETWLFQNNDS